MIGNVVKDYFITNKSISIASGTINSVFSGSEQMPLNTLKCIFENSSRIHVKRLKLLK